MIKAIYFDFDGVLTPDKNDGYTTCENLSKATGIPFEKLYAAYSPYLEKLYVGKVTNQEIWPEFCKVLGKEIDFKLLVEALKNTPKNLPMIALARKLKDDDYHVGVITNQAMDRFNSLKDDFELESIFDPIIVSAKIGCTKRGEFGGKKIFEEAMKPWGLEPNQCVFIDNSKSNLVIPAEMGFHTYFHDDQKNDVESFKRWLDERLIG